VSDNAKKVVAQVSGKKPGSGTRSSGSSSSGAKPSTAKSS
jgi:hypothetical protein